MQRIVNNQYNIVKYYINENIECSVPIINKLTDYVHLDSNYLMNQDVKIGIEASKYVGPRYLYGFLLVSFEGKISNGVNIEIPYTISNKQPYEKSILYDKSHCFEGLPKEYVHGLMDKIKCYIEQTDSFPNCNIRIDFAANCEVSSCLAWYEYIMETILYLFVNGEYKMAISWDDTELMKLWLNKTGNDSI